MNKYQFERFVADILPILDTQFDTFIDLVQRDHTRKRLENIFKEYGINMLDPLGEKFNPEQMQCMEMKASDKPSGTVLKVLQRGYELHERLMIPPLVVVAK